MGDGKAAAGAKPVRRAVMFELDHLAVNGRERKMEALRSALKTMRIDLSEIQYGRYTLDAPPAYGLTAICRAMGKGTPTEEAQEQLKAALDKAFRDSALHLDPACEALLKAARKLDARVGAVSNLEPGLAEALANHLGLPAQGVTLTTATRGHGRAFGGDHWTPLARRLEVPHARCVAVCTSNATFRAALFARMRCMVRLDAFNGYQDFSGADVISPTLDPSVLGRLLGVEGR